jgi:RHS repeat-associated protein
MLDPARERIQRIVLAAGWNLVAAAVGSSASLREAFGQDAAVYEARDGSYAPLAPGGAVPAGQAIWVYAPAARLAALRGPPVSVAAGATAGPLHAWPFLEPFRPAEHLESPAPILVYDAKIKRWLRRDPTLPSFLSDAPAELGAAQAFWSPEAVTLRLPAAPAGTVYYHQDQLGSTAVVTDAGGGLVEERGHYPFGAVRYTFGARSPGGVDHDFTDKERDGESGLVVMGARCYLDIAGVFLSPDPRYAEAPALGFGSQADQQSLTAFLANPQMGNLYAYAARNPLKFVDPSGLDVVFSKALRDSPVFREALDVFKATAEGKRVLASIERSGAKVTIGAGKVFAENPKTGKVGRAFGETSFGKGKRFSITIDLIHHKDVSKSHDALIEELADTIHHEFRHVEGELNKKGGVGQARKTLDILDDFMKQHGMPTSPVSPLFRQGEEVHQALDSRKHPNEDPQNAKFRSEAAEVIKKENE